MKNKKIILPFLVSIFLIQSCTKKETIIQEYKQPVPTLYGTWLAINENPLDLKKRFIIINANDDFIYQLEEDEYGFKRSENYAFNATDKQLNLGGGLYNYTTKGDTLTLRQSNNYIQKLIKVANPTMNADNWISKLSISKAIAAPHNNNISSSRSFGFNGDFLYFYSNKYANRVYKFNTLNYSFTDSINTLNACSNFYRNGFTYFGFSGSNFIGKTTELIGYNPISTNTLSNVYAISQNGTSNTIYAYTSNSDLYAGNEGGAFSVVKNLDQYDINSVVYYGSDEFLCLEDGEIHKIKISPNFTVTKSYNRLNNYSLYTLSTNGIEVWAFAYNNNSDKYEYLKLNLN